MSEPAPAPGGNRFGLMEWSGAFGDLGTLVPFVVAYISVVKLDAFGVLFAFGLAKIATGLFYKTPIPVQPMKAIGAAAISQSGTITSGMIFSAGLVSGIIWLVLGLTNLVGWIAKFVSRPVVSGIVLGLGLLFVIQGIQMIIITPWLGAPAAIVTLFLISKQRIPVMFLLLIVGAGVAFWQQPGLFGQIAQTGVRFRWPAFSLGGLNWQTFASGALLLALPQVPLTLGNAIISIRAENNELFPERKVTERKLSITTGLMNLFSPIVGGVPLCHGAGGMAGHVRFGARTGGALVILGALLLVLALFFSDSAALIFQLFPEAILGVILLFAGAELALTAKDIGPKKSDFYIMLLTAGFAMWNMLAAFLVGIFLYQILQRRWIKI
jgi:MFS superfamily sulfate permease-like transporter